VLASEDAIRPRLSGIGPASLVLYGHTHIPCVVQVGDAPIVNPGGIGMPATRMTTPSHTPSKPMRRTPTSPWSRENQIIGGQPNCAQSPMIATKPPSRRPPPTVGPRSHAGPRWAGRDTTGRPIPAWRSAANGSQKGADSAAADRSVARPPLRAETGPTPPSPASLRSSQ
jgi:hypothetical protein